MPSVSAHDEGAGEHISHDIFSVLLTALRLTCVGLRWCVVALPLVLWQSLVVPTFVIVWPPRDEGHRGRPGARPRARRPGKPALDVRRARLRRPT